MDKPSPCRAHDLDSFVNQIDALGGPDATAAQILFTSFEYEPTVQIDQDLDPLSEQYIQQQLALYREISGRDINAAVNELLDFNFQDHVDTPNPYGPAWSPSSIALHYARISKAVRHADLKSGAAVLDLGCGWGLSTEFLALLGCRVTGVDINPAFVDLVKARNSISRLTISAEWGGFDSYDTDRKFDAILFYECFHHAMAPWDLIGRAKRWLNPDGKIMLAGEPIQDIWWRHWGMRLDGLSVYCIRKFGWFESGWSMPFLSTMFTGQGFGVDIVADQDGQIGQIVIAKKLQSKIFDNASLKISEAQGWIYEGDMAVSTGDSAIGVTAPDKGQTVKLQLMNFRGREIRVIARVDRQPSRSIILAPGSNTLSLDCAVGLNRIILNGEKWCPDVELRNGDTRFISFHLVSIGFD